MTMHIKKCMYRGNWMNDYPRSNFNLLLTSWFFIHKSYFCECSLITISISSQFPLPTITYGQKYYVFHKMNNMFQNLNLTWELLQKVQRKKMMQSIHWDYHNYLQVGFVSKADKCHQK